MTLKRFRECFRPRKDRTSTLVAETEEMIKKFDEDLEKRKLMGSSIEPVSFKFRFDDGRICECKLGSEEMRDCLSRADARLIFD